MSDREAEYAAKRAFLKCCVDDLRLFGEVAPDIHPITLLDEMASRSPAMARKGLDMAINDTLEDIADWPIERREQADVLLRQKGLMTTSQALSRFSSRVRQIMKRGRVASETEYYLLKGVADGMNFATPDESTKAERMLADFEQREVARFINSTK